jgi:predicted pyridoxine 5'-phosphate oxidase superfamily flavin-nucleotide-binding protein
MAHKFAEIAFTPVVRAIQVEEGSRAGYSRMDGGDDYNHLLGSREANFIAASDSFYMASVGETGWPYVQHRGGPAGFMKVLDERTIGFADYAGNRQYVSTGNFRSDNRVALFFMDYANRRRLKMLGRVRTVERDEPALLARLEDDDYPARIERGFIIEVEGFDWNCPQHITRRFTEAQIEDQLAALREENRQLKDLLASAASTQPAATTALNDQQAPQMQEERSKQ